MATGSSHSVYEDLPWIKKTKEFIRQIYAANKFFVGFCFGHQLMAAALGGKVEKAKIGWCVGVHQISISKLKHWMRPAKTKINILFMCQDQVTKLPKDAILLAGTPKCPNAMLQIGDRMMSIQGHPEFSRAYDQLLMEVRIDRMGKEIVEEGITSLQQPIDMDLFRSWTHHFLKG